MQTSLFQHYLVAARLPVLSEEGQPSRTHLALDLTNLDPVCLRLGPDPGPRILEFLDSFHHRRDADLEASPRAFSGGVHEEQSFLVESWVVGASLAALRAETRRSTKAAVHLAWSLTRALADLHGQYLIHGDLHPENVLVDRRGSLKLVGEFPSPLQGADTTLPEEIEARRYAAPEVDAGGPPTTRADVFSLGLLLYEIFEGRRLLAKHGKGGFPMDPTLQAKINRAVEDSTRLPSRIRQVIFQCLRLVPENRPPHAGEILHLLIQAGEEIPSGEDRRASQRRMARLALRSVARTWLPEPVAKLETRQLLENASGVWRFSQGISRRDRSSLAKGYQAVVDCLWLALAATGPHESPRALAEAGVALFWVHRAVHHWKSRTLCYLVEALAARVLSENNPLRLAMTTQAILPSVREALLARCMEQLRKSPRSNRALVTLAILDEGFEVPRGVALARVKAQVLARAGLTREAMLHQVEGVVGSEEATESAIRDLADLAAAALDHRAPSLAGRKPRVEASDSDTDSSGTRSGVDLPELLEALGQAHALSRPKPVESSEPPGAGDSDEEDLTLDSGVSSGVDLDETSPFEVDLDNSQDGIPIDNPSSSPGRQRGPDSTFSLSEEHAAALFSKGQSLLAEDRLEEATGVFQELAGAGLLQRAHFRVALTSELRRLLWRVVHPRAPKATRILVELWELCLNLKLDDLTSLCELLLLRRRVDAPVEVMVKRRPRSPHLLAACIERCEAKRDLESVAHFQVLLAQLHLDCGELAGAAQMLQRVPPEKQAADHAQAWQRMFQVAETIADAAAEYRRLLGELSETEYADYHVQRLAAFLAEHPFFGAAREHLVELGLEHELPRRTGMEGVILAEIHVLRQRPEHARRLLRRILDLEQGNDEAMLLLAALATNLDDVSLDRALLRPHILAQEGAVRAAYHQALRGLSGGPEDVPLRELLIRLCQRLGRNPAPHRLSLGMAALEAGDADRARSLCTAALAESEDPRSLVDQLLEHPRIGELFARPELMRLAEPPDTVQA